MIETHLHPNVVAAIEKGELGTNWRALATRIEAQEGRWQLVSVTQRNDKGIAAEVRERLRGVGCIAQVVALQGMMIHQRPWSGWAVFARIPRSVRTPTGKLI